MKDYFHKIYLLSRSYFSNKLLKMIRYFLSLFQTKFAKPRGRRWNAERERERVRKRSVNTEILKEESIVVPYNS